MSIRELHEILRATRGFSCRVCTNLTFFESYHILLLFAKCNVELCQPFIRYFINYFAYFNQKTEHNTTIFWIVIHVFCFVAQKFLVRISILNKTVIASSMSRESVDLNLKISKHQVKTQDLKQKSRKFFRPCLKIRDDLC